ncbi:reverse transcriptase domain-containing protein [Tanacetum coccineum]|uniref:Reverse transcriptase domain-containing protein n=1 Tax=Tanacetum coccineum TaxID=301880 RepID=A0ABQ5AU35_9ASTR
MDDADSRVLREGDTFGRKRKIATAKSKSKVVCASRRKSIQKFVLGSWLRCASPKQANYMIREIHEGSCSMHSGPRPIPRLPKTKLKTITSPWPFHKWGIDICGLFPEVASKVKFLILAIDYFTKWIEAKPVAAITRKHVMKFVWDNITSWKKKRELATIDEEKHKRKMKGYYNSKVRSTIRKPRDLVYRSNEASKQKGTGKLGPKWEGPYEITEAIGDGAYKLRDHEGNQLPRTWNIADLKRCYI